MAFGNYAYNPYINPYMVNPQQQQMQMTVPTQTPQQPPSSQNGFVWVDGIDEAKNFFVAPNSAVQLWDKSRPFLYKKEADSTGKPTMQIFELVERTTDTADLARNDDFSRFATKEDIRMLEDKIAKMEQKNAKERVKEKKTDE